MLAFVSLIFLKQVTKQSYHLSSTPAQSSRWFVSCRLFCAHINVSLCVMQIPFFRKPIQRSVCSVTGGSLSLLWVCPHRRAPSPEQLRAVALCGIEPKLLWPWHSGRKPASTPGERSLPAPRLSHVPGLRASCVSAPDREPGASSTRRPHCVWAPASLRAADTAGPVSVPRGGPSSLHVHTRTQCVTSSR